MYLVVVIAILYVLGFIFRWNYSIWWYDWLLHLLGGMWVAFVAKKFFRGPMGRIGRAGPLFLVALVALVGVTWEIYEFTLDELFFKEAARWRAQAGNTDTMTDLIIDLTGGVVVAFWYAHSTFNVSNDNDQKLSHK